MTSQNPTTRESRAQALITAGAVSLFVGQGMAEVKGSKGVTYTVTKDQCGCPDFTRRGVDCKHRIASRLLCEEYRALKATAQRGERIRPSSALLQAIRWPTLARDSETLAHAKVSGCRDCGAPTDFDQCSGCFFGQPVAA